MSKNGHTPNEEMEFVLGSPGGGKSVGCARDGINYPGTCVILDPQKDSIASLVLENDTSPNIYYDRLSDSNHPLALGGLLKPSTHPDPARRMQLDQLRVQTMVEIMMRGSSGDLASTPLKQEWLMAIQELYLSQATRKPLSMLPYGFMPGTDEFRALVSGTSRADLRHKFQQIEKLSLRGLRAEVGSANRVVTRVFRNPAVIARLDGVTDIGTLLQKPKARIIIERGDEIDEEAVRMIFGAYSVLIAEYCEMRPKPSPMVKVFYEECVSAGTVGQHEEKKAAQVRKFGEVMVFITQWLPSGSDRLLSVCGRKLVYRTADYDLARKMASAAEPGFPEDDRSRADRVAWLTNRIMNFQPGERLVTDRSGSRIQRVPMIESPWPEWLRESKLKEKLCRIHARPEYRRPPAPCPTSGGGTTPSSSPSSPSSPSPLPTSRRSSPAERFGRGGKKPPSGSADSGSGDGSGS